MKRYWRKITVLAAAAVMTVAPVMTVCAKMAKEDTVYTITTTKASWETGTLVKETIPMKVVFSDEQKLTDPEVIGWAEKQLPVVEGAEWKAMYMYRDKNASKDTDFWWGISAEHSANWKPVKENMEEGKLVHLYNFSLIINGQNFSACKIYGGAMGDYETEDGFAGEHCMFVLVPLGYDGDITFTLYGGKLENDNRVKDETQNISYRISGHTKDAEKAAEEAEKAAKEAEEAAKQQPSWKQDHKGWWLENPDGTYWVNAWYQSPESGLWYYLGDDGYMLRNTTTPDHYKVNADGVWVQ